jgi:hypothetical protein
MITLCITDNSIRPSNYRSKEQSDHNLPPLTTNYGNVRQKQRILKTNTGACGSCVTISHYVANRDFIRRLLNFVVRL